MSWKKSSLIGKGADDFFVDGCFLYVFELVDDDDVSVALLVVFRVDFWSVAAVVVDDVDKLVFDVVPLLVIPTRAARLRRVLKLLRWSSNLETI